MADPTPSRPAVAAVGGGSGLPVLLRGLRLASMRGEAAPPTAVVTVADDGGSSGRLRRDYDVPPPGDIRNCIAALSPEEALLTDLFQYRFPGGDDGLSGHTFGNLFLTALTRVTGDFYRAILEAEKILSVHGRILPATLEHVTLRATGVSGAVYEGESAVGRAAERISRIELLPGAPPAFPVAVDALRQADLVVLGPGSVYTSILPNLLVPGIREVLREREGPVVFVMNLMTQPGETDGMDAAAHLDAIGEAVGRDVVDTVLLSAEEPSAEIRERYAEEGAEPVRVDRDALRDRGARLVEAGFLAGGDLLRHDPARLTEAVLGLAESSARVRPGEVA